MDCKTVEEHLLEYSLSKLSADVARAAEAHLAGCDSCRKALERSRKVVSRLADLRSEGAADGLAEAVWATIRREEADERPKGRSRRQRRREFAGARRTSGKRLAWVLPLAAAASLLAGAFFLIPDRSQGEKTARTGAPQKTQEEQILEDRPAVAETGPVRQQPPAPPEGVATGPTQGRPAVREEPSELALSRPAESTEPSVPTGPAEPEETIVPLASFALISGSVYYRRAGEKWNKAVEGVKLVPGDEVDTRLGMAAAELEGGGRVYFNRSSWGRFEPGRLDLRRGEACCEFRAGEKGFRVTSVDGLVRHLGTRFSVKVLPGGTTVTVAEGRVLVENEEGKVEVDESFQVKVKRGFAPGEPKKADVEKAFAWVRDIRPRLAVLLAEDFEKTAPGGLPGAFRVERPGVWAVRELDGNRVLAGEGDKTTAGFGEVGWRDYEVRLRFRFDAFPSAVGLVVRHDPATGRNYQLELHPGGACLRRSLDALRDDPDVVRGRASPASGVWHALRVSCRGEVVELWVDGKLVLRSRETLAARGRCKLYVRSGTVYFDDISVREVGP